MFEELKWQYTRRTVGLSSPWNTSRYYQIILSTQEIHLTTDRTNCPTTGREEATWRMVGGMEMWFGGEQDSRVWRGEGAMVAGKGGGGEHTGKQRERTLPQNHWLRKPEGLIFVRFCNQQGSKTNFRGWPEKLG